MRSNTRSPYLSSSFAMVLAVVLATAATGCHRKFREPTTGMEPTIPKDSTFTARMFRSGETPIVRRGDIVLFPYPPAPERLFVKRVVAVSGDTVEIRDKTLLVNGQSAVEPYVSHKDQKVLPIDPQTPAFLRFRDNLPPQQLAQGTLFVLGDNRDESVDSRSFGPIPANAVRGIVDAP